MNKIAIQCEVYVQIQSTVHYTERIVWGNVYIEDKEVDFKNIHAPAHTQCPSLLINEF